jgi:integrase
LGINTAFRANELLSIKVGEVRYLGVGDTLTLKQRKTQKYRSVVLNDNVVESIKNHLRVASLSDEAALFTGLRGCLTVPTVNRLVKTWCASVGLKGNYGSRRCFRAVDVLSSQIERIINVSEESYDHPSLALPLLPGH